MRARIDTDLVIPIKRRAKENDRSFAKQVNRMLREMLNAPKVSRSRKEGK